MMPGGCCSSSVKVGSRHSVLLSGAVQVPCPVPCPSTTGTSASHSFLSITVIGVCKHHYKPGGLAS